MKRIASFICAVAVLGCSGGGGGGGGPTLQAAPLVLAAGMVRLEPAAGAPVGNVDLSRLDVSDVGVVYELTTPAGEPFCFDLLSRNEGNEGAVRVSVSHAADGGVTPAGGVESLAVAGIAPSGGGAGSDGLWFDATGDGFARVTLNGKIDREQVIAVEAENGAGGTTAIVRLKIGAPSEINLPERTGGDYPGVLDERTIYSSDSGLFGLPTVAVSGDRTSVVVYEGDRADPYAYERYELRMQVDHESGDVTGGASTETSPDSGNWRDHEIAALFNVLALAHSGTDQVTLKLSFDRGATFSQVRQFGAGGSSARLVQVAMAEDYTLGLVFWRATPGGRSELVYVEGRPAAFDGGGSPTAFSFDPARVLLQGPGDIMPVIMGMAWSEGGDLVIGYGWTLITWNPQTMEMTSTTEFHCLVRRFGDGTFHDGLVERDVTVARDPSVAVVGTGDTLKIFFAYEGREGVRLRTSADGGLTWSDPIDAGDGWSYQPTVLARAQDDALRVDLLYLTFAEIGTELHLLHWDDFGATEPTRHRLTEATQTPIDGEPGDPFPRPLPPGDDPSGGPGIPDDPPRIQQVGIPILPPEYQFRLTQVSWFGYDATLDGDDVVVVVNEQTTNPYDIIYFGGDVRFGGAGGGPALPTADGSFVPAEPPPLAPGLTEPLPPPDPDHMNQLKLIRMD